MKMVTAIIQPFRLDHVIAALSEAGVVGLNVTECCGYGHQHGLNPLAGGVHQYAVSEGHAQLTVPVDEVATVIETIVKGACAGQIGDGKIFIASIEEAIRIRTNERNHQALV